MGAGTTQASSTRAIVYGLGQHLNGLLDYSGSTVPWDAQPALPRARPRRRERQTGCGDPSSP